MTVTPPPVSAEEGWASKTGGLAGPQLLEGLAGKEAGDDALKDATFRGKVLKTNI